MRAAKTKDTLVLTFNFLESRILQHHLQQIIANYQIKPQEMDPKTASVWYSTLGCEKARMSAEETREWLENLFQYKSNNVQHLKKWLGALDSPKEGAAQLRLKLQDASILLTALNDHRLLLAAKHDIGQKEMDMRSLPAFDRLSPAQQTAISEIHFLAWVLEEILRFLPGNPGGWMESLH